MEHTEHKDSSRTTTDPLDQTAIYFGVGCLQFIPKSEEPYSFTVRSYASQVKEALETLSSVKHVEVHVDFIFEDKEFVLEDGMPSVSDGEYFFPDTANLKIKFQVYIPVRVQQQIAGGDRSFTRTYAEHFTIILSYEYYSPVAIVIPHSVNPKAKGSDAIFIVRKHLERMMVDTAACKMKLETLGPSPFHANFDLRCIFKKECLLNGMASKRRTR